MNTQRGFTLTELMVVIAVIGILSGIVIASLDGARERARDAKRVTDIRSTALALELYYEAEDEYPSALSELAPTYISSLPNDPVGASGGHFDYVYVQLSSGQDFHLGAVLEEDNDQLQDDADTANGFHGNTTNCSGSSVTSPERCFDVIP
jgi:prepilin-type N-terminal cleavage/methylation domain-containing protein